MIDACAIKHLDYYQQALPFIACLEEGITNIESQGEKCASDLGINWTQIK
jgi:hypothetical protein